MDENVVIGFAGLPGAGKSTAIEAVKPLGDVITMGDVVRNEVKKNGLQINPETLGKTARDLRRTHGPNIIAEKCVAWIKDSKCKIAFVDGIRSMNEVNIFRQVWTFPIVAIICPRELRHDRLRNRGRSDDSLDLEAIRKRDEREIGFGLKKVLENADIKIENTGSKQFLKQRTQEAVKKLIADLK